MQITIFGILEDALRKAAEEGRGYTLDEAANALLYLALKEHDDDDIEGALLKM